MSEVRLLREAAAAMRTIASEAAKPENSHPYGDMTFPPASSPEAFGGMMRDYLGGPWGEQAAAWHPLVALAVSRWLDSVAVHWEAVGDDWLDEDGDPIKPEETIDGHHALDVARAYLGRDYTPASPSDGAA